MTHDPQSVSQGRGALSTCTLSKGPFSLLPKARKLVQLLSTERHLLLPYEGTAVNSLPAFGDTGVGMTKVHAPWPSTLHVSKVCCAGWVSPKALAMQAAEGPQRGGHYTCL